MDLHIVGLTHKELLFQNTMKKCCTSKCRIIQFLDTTIDKINLIIAGQRYPRSKLQTFA